jgi:hypothetical protein
MLSEGLSKVRGLGLGAQGGRHRGRTGPICLRCANSGDCMGRREALAPKVREAA